MKRLFILGLVLVIAGITHAADILKVQDVVVPPGESVTLNIELNNTTTNLMGWQCDISLPEGLTLELKTNGKPAGTLSDRFSATNHQISSNCLANGNYRFITTSIDGEAIPGTSGILFSVTLKADVSLTSGTLTGTIKNIEFNTQDNQKVTISDVTFSVKVSGGDNPGEDNPGGDTPTEGLKVSDVSIGAGGNLPVDVLLENTTTNLMGWQCDISLPEGLTLELKDNGKPAATLGDRFSTTEHTISSNRLSNGDYRFVATSIEGEAIPGTSGTLFTVTLKADASLTLGTKLTGTIKNIEFNTQDNQKLTFEDVQFSVTIDKPLVITVKNQTRIYGEANPEFEFDVEGGELNGTPEISCEATAASPVGTYDIIISKGSVTNSSVTYVNGKLTITKAPLTITAKDYTIKQGEALPSFEATYEGFKNSETSAVLTKQPAITTTATSASEPGDYDITVSGAEAKNYEISYVKGKLTILARDLIPGDANGDGEVNVADVDYVIEHIGEVLDVTNKAADVNDDGEINVADVDYIIERIV